MAESEGFSNFGIESKFLSPDELLLPASSSSRGTTMTEVDVDLLIGITTQLTSFRLSLASSQAQMLQKLDRELDVLAGICRAVKKTPDLGPVGSSGPKAVNPQPPLMEAPPMASESSVKQDWVDAGEQMGPIIGESNASSDSKVRKKALFRRNSSASIIIQDGEQQKKSLSRRRSASVQEGPRVVHNSEGARKNSLGARKNSLGLDPVLPGQSKANDAEDYQNSGTESMPLSQPRARTSPEEHLPSLAKPKKKSDSWFKQTPMMLKQDKPRLGRSKTKKEDMKGSKEASGAKKPRDEASHISSMEAYGACSPENTPAHEDTDEAAAGSPVKSSARTLIPDEGLFGKMHTEFSIESVQKHLMGETGHEMADNRCSEIVSNPWFERAMMTVVILNCIELAISVEFDWDASNEILHETLVAIENVFCTIFLMEILVRSFTYRRFRNLLQDGWYLFDLLLVALMMWETWLMPILQASSSHFEVSGAWRMARILRVLRTARMARLVRLMPELMILIKGMLVACRSVFFTLLLLLIVTFVFSIAFLELSRGTILEVEYFPSTLSAILSLILHCIVPDQEGFFKAVVAENWGLGVLVLLFILLGSLTVMNMLLGVLVEAVKTVSTIEREHMMADFARRVLWQLIQSDKEDPDEDDYCDRMISEKEFRSLLRKPKAVKALSKLGVDPQNALDNGKLLFEDGGSVSFMDFMRAMLTLRGSNKTTVKDMVEMRKYLSEEFQQIRTLFGEMVSFIGDTFPQPVARSNS